MKHQSQTLRFRKEVWGQDNSLCDRLQLISKNGKTISSGIRDELFFVRGQVDPLEKVFVLIAVILNEFSGRSMVQPGSNAIGNE